MARGSPKPPGAETSNHAWARLDPWRAVAAQTVDVGLLIALRLSAKPPQMGTFTCLHTSFKSSSKPLIVALAMTVQACMVQAEGGSESDEHLAEVTLAADAGTQRIVSLHSGKALDVADWNTQNGGNVQQWTYGGGNNQAWIITLTRFGAEIKNAHSGKCLDVAGPSAADGANVHQWDCHNGTSQRWQPSEVYVNGAAYTKYANASSGKCLDVANWSTADGGNIQQWTCAAAQPNQLWQSTFN